MSLGPRITAREIELRCVMAKKREKAAARSDGARYKTKRLRRSLILWRRAYLEGKCGLSPAS